MKVFIVDDEKPNRKGLRLMLQQCCPAVKHIFEAESSKAARTLLNTHQPDIIFLDINMPNENGFEFLNSIPEHHFAVVFVTAYSEFAIRAFKANAVDYLLKPVDEEELQSAVEKCQQQLILISNGNFAREIYSPSLSNLKQTLENREFPSKLTLPHHQGFKIIDTNEIVHIEADGNYCTIHLSAGKSLLVTRALREFEFMLNPDIFFRSHKSALINLRYVKEYSSVDGHFALMQDGRRVMISRRRLDEFMAAIDNLSSRI
ncbi:MAG TPA: LytTR family DNA-binding domain-containing protein [Bacteroidia bacterium]|nr:LytTR family DNA-binding domain-containing protein [Bacteroidia bacterium]